MNNELYIKYKNILPDSLVEYTGNNSFGNGLINLCDPDKYLDLISDGYTENCAVPFAVTAFGDIIVWEKSKYVTVVSFSKKKVTVIESGFNFFFEDISDISFLKKYFNYDLYMEALESLGECKETECYVCSPIPFIGGTYELNKLSIGKLREYVAVCVEICGKIKTS